MVMNIIFESSNNSNNLSNKLLKIGNELFLRNLVQGVFVSLKIVKHYQVYKFNVF